MQPPPASVCWSFAHASVFIPTRHPSRQRVFRGFRGKVSAQRWALKRAEIEALKSVLHEAAVNVQRAYRGHLGRVEASEVTRRQGFFRKSEKGDSRSMLLCCGAFVSSTPYFCSVVGLHYRSVRPNLSREKQASSTLLFSLVSLKSILVCFLTRFAAFVLQPPRIKPCEGEN